MTIETLLAEQLEPLARRLRRRRLWIAWSACWGVAAAIAMALQQAEPAAARTGVLILWPTVAALSAGLWHALRTRPIDPRTMARLIERRHPELGTLLRTAVEQHAGDGKPLSYLQQEVIRQALTHGNQHTWRGAVPAMQLSAAGAVCLLAALWMLSASVPLLRPSGASLRSPHAEADADRVTVHPGDVEVERGSSLVVTARFDREPPADATLVLSAEGAADRRIELTKNLDDPVFGGVIPHVDRAWRYRVEFADGVSRFYHVEIYDRPELQRADAAIDYPDYTGLEDKTLEDTRDVSLPAGSRLTLEMQLNKAVREAVLVDGDQTIRLEAVEGREGVYQTTTVPDESRRY